MRAVAFGPLSPEAALRQAVVVVASAELLVRDGPRAGLGTQDGVLDARLGPSRAGVRCAVCEHDVSGCAGHWGVLPLAAPLVHPGYAGALCALLNSVCRRCARALLSPSDLDRLAAARVTARPVDRPALARSAREACKKARGVCPHCVAVQVPIKRVGAASLVEAVSGRPIDGEDLRRLLLRIPRADAEIFDVAEPAQLLVMAVPVPPVCVRPPVGREQASGSRNEDTLTMQLASMVRLNARILAAIRRSDVIQSRQIVMEQLQAQYAAFVDNSKAERGSRRLQRGLVQRLDGKSGRFRQNLSGKRVNFTARSTIGPDPNLRVDEVGVPLLIACRVTVPETVCDGPYSNVARLREAVRRGPRAHPGAVRVVRVDGSVVSLAFGDKNAHCAALVPGDVVERHLCDGDVVLFNRQPSLHRGSVMAHRVRVLPHRTLRLNECVCTPYGADFDGDEMNLHVLQTVEARAEAAVLMGVAHNLVTPKTGEPIVGAIQDFVTLAYLLTCKDRFLTRGQVWQLACAVDAGATRRVSVPAPALWKPVELWTGKQVFGMLLTPLANSRGACLFLEGRTRAFVPRLESSSFPWMDEEDAYVVLRGSELLCGRVDKKIIGAGAKQNVVHVLIRELGGVAAVAWLSHLTRVCGRWAESLGFSIGLDDVTPSADLSARTRQLVADGFAQCAAIIGQEPLRCEALVQNELSSVREKAGKACMQHLNEDNAALVMSACGSKGSALNISQMVALVGQQILAGARIPDGYTARTLPHFPRQARDPQSRGFASSSFASGLGPTEFFFHAMAGREGIIDTAVKTSETGYMQRRLVKAVEDLVCCADLSVRTPHGHVIQFRYGGDGISPTQLAGDGDSVANFEAILAQCRLAGGGSVHGVPAVIAERVGDVAQRDRWSAGFRAQAQAFLMGVIEKRTPPVTEGTVEEFLARLRQRHAQALMEPGSPVGVLCAQSIGEPATQMTLRTFHSAGIGANITMGVPRLTELINAHAVPKTPVIVAAIADGCDPEAVQVRIDTVWVKHVFRADWHVPAGNPPFLELTLVREQLEHLGLQHDFFPRYAASAIARTPRLGITEKDVQWDKDRVLIETSLGKAAKRTARARVSDATGGLVELGLESRLETLVKRVGDVVVAGLPDVTGVTLATDGRSLVVEGGAFQDVLQVTGVDALRTVTNNIKDIADVLGVEAARAALMKEVKAVMDQHGIELNRRHLSLLADYMCWTGQVLGVTRHGMAKTKESVLMMASFERTGDNLFDAAVRGRTDDLRGVSEAVLVGNRIPLGTGSVAVSAGT